MANRQTFIGKRALVDLKEFYVLFYRPLEELEKNQTLCDVNSLR